MHVWLDDFNFSNDDKDGSIYVYCFEGDHYN